MSNDKKQELLNIAKNMGMDVSVSIYKKSKEDIGSEIVTKKSFNGKHWKYCDFSWEQFEKYISNFV